MIYYFNILFNFQSSVAKLLNVYRYNFPETTIILANPTLRIYWSGVSILEAGLDCMEQLINANAEWKFFFNAIGTAMPGRPIQVPKLTGLPDISDTFISNLFKTPE